MASSHPDTQSSRFETIRRYLVRYRRYLVWGALSLVLTNTLMLVIPYITKLVVDDLEAHRPLSLIGKWALVMIGLSLAAGVFRFLTRRTIIWMSRRIEYDLRGQVVRHLLKLSPSFYDHNRTGDLIVRVTSDVEAVRMMVGPGIMQFSNAVITLVVALPMMVYLSPRLTLYALAPAILLPVIVHRLGNSVHRKSVRIQDHFSQLTATAQENLAGIRVVKAYRQEANEIRHFEKMSDRYRYLYVDMGKLQAMFFPLIQFLGFSLTLVVLYFGGREVIRGTVPLGTIVAFLAYLGSLLWPMMAVGWVVSLYQRGTASLDRINRILRTQPAIADRGGHLCSKPISGHIEFRHLSFAYNGQPVLKDISLVVRPGQTLGILGLTAAGKTTLVSLIARLYPVERGKLFVDHVDINDWDLKALRRQIGFATQEPFLFSDTMRGNIGFGVDSPDEPDIELVTSVAALDKDVRTFPGGYNTIVGERGITLSGGQKQRTAIARALLIKPAILILDDATSSVDTETEQEINRRIQRFSKRLTTLVISHRVSSVKDSDRIVFLGNGMIVEDGTHDELMARDTRYASLYRAQLLAMELEQL